MRSLCCARPAKSLVMVPVICAVPLVMSACEDKAKPSSTPWTSTVAPHPSVAPIASTKPEASASTTAAPISKDPLLAAPTKPKFKVEDIPLIPDGDSDPPLGEEWNNGVPVNSQGLATRAPMCSVLVLREWLRVFCQGDVVGYEQKSGFGTHGSDYYELFVPHKSATLILRMKTGTNQKLRICRKADRASLFVTWPKGRDRPSLVALGAGPECDGSDWGDMAKGPAASKKLDADEEIDESRLKASLKIHNETSVAAEAKCREGDADGCMFACGKKTCP